MNLLFIWLREHLAINWECLKRSLFYFILIKRWLLTGRFSEIYRKKNIDWPHFDDDWPLKRVNAWKMYKYCFEHIHWLTREHKTNSFQWAIGSNNKVCTSFFFFSSFYASLVLHQTNNPNIFVFSCMLFRIRIRRTHCIRAVLSLRYDSYR